MPTLDEELRQDEENDAREAEYIISTLPQELKEKFSTDDIIFIINAIVDYYFASGVLEKEPDDDGYIDIDLEKIAEDVCRQAAEQAKGPYNPDEVLLIVQADFDYQGGED